MKKQEILPQNIIDIWAPAIFDYIHLVIHGEKELEENTELELTTQMVNAMAHIGESFAQGYRANDSVTVFRYERNLQEVFLEFKKIKTNIHFGFDDYKGFYVNNYLSFQYCLKSTNDKFWCQLFELFNYGKVEYTQTALHSLPQDKKKIFTRNKNASINMFIDFIINSLNNEDELISEIKVQIDKCNSHEELFTKIFKCVDIFQSLNYQLYHIDYLHKR